MAKEVKKVQALLSLTNTMGIAIHYEDGSDDIYSKYVGGDSVSRWTKAEIQYDDESRAYFNRSGAKYYIDEFIKLDYYSPGLKK